MFIAKREDGSYYSLLDGKPIPNSGPYFCPACGGKLQMKVGEKRRPHFAHYRADCNASTERESLYHLEGKRQLYYLLKKYGNTTMEHYVIETRQRIDVLLETKNRRYAVEFQCSTIPATLMVERTKSYFSQNLFPLWILSKKRFQNTLHQTISSFEWLYLNYPTHSPTPFFISFCPYDKKFRYIIPYFPYSQQKAFILSLSTENLYVHHFPSMKFPSYWRKRWVEYKRKWRYEYCLYNGMIALKKYCYQHYGVSLTQLPAEIGLPVPSQFFMQTPLIEWQAWLFYDCIFTVPTGSIIHLPSVVQMFERRVKEGKIKIRTLPLVERVDYTNAVRQYVEALVAIGLLSKKMENIYVKRRSINSNANMEELMKQDERFIKAISLV